MTMSLSTEPSRHSVAQRAGLPSQCLDNPLGCPIGLGAVPYSRILKDRGRLSAPLDFLFEAAEGRLSIAIEHHLKIPPRCRAFRGYLNFAVLTSKEALEVRPPQTRRLRAE